MSGAVDRIPLARAEDIAALFLTNVIGPWCERAQVAGSIRRRAATVGDIEIVAVPRVEQISERDMFGDVTSTGQYDWLAEQLRRCAESGVVQKRTRSDGKTVWGQKMKYLTFEGVNVDLFTPEATRFGLILMIRTGPAAYSHQLVTEKGKTLVVGHQPNGRPITRTGLLPAHLRVVEGWLTSRVSGQKIPTPEERDFYEATGLPYIAPEKRR